MSQIQRLREQIDACRGGSDDLALPALAELARAAQTDHAVADELARSQHFDRATRAALHDVPVPSGLVERLLTAVGPQVDLPARNDDSSPALKQRSRVVSRRFIAVAGSLALVTLFAISAYQFWPRSGRLVTKDELSSAVAGWLVQTARQPQAWNDGQPKDVALDGTVSGRAQRWQQFQMASENGWSARVTAIDVAPPGKPRAILFVVQSSARFQVPPTPASRLSLSGGLKAVAWQPTSTGVLYVLAVDEDAGQTLDSYLRPLHVG
jgi:hypothetical protein